MSPEPSQRRLPWSYTGPLGSAFQIGIFLRHLPVYLTHIHLLTPGGRGLKKAPRDRDTVVLLWAHASSTRSGFWTLVSEGPFQISWYWGTHGVCVYVYVGGIYTYVNAYGWVDA